MSRRSEGIDIEHNPGYKDCGVYKIHLVNSNGSQIEILRFLGKDKEGILQIGSSKNIETRIKAFRGAMEGKQYHHVEGRRFGLIKSYPSFTRKYENYKIQYSFKKLQNESQAKKEEERLLKSYFEKFGEPPPLNNNLPNKDKRKRKR